jgi:hypothetical protein
MNAEENLILQGIKLEIAMLTQTLSAQQVDDERSALLRDLPEWVNLNKAATLKGGCAFETYKTRWWYQPCCGLKSKRIGGRKCWHRDDVIDWLLISDDKLWEYAEKFQIKIPDKYKELSA